MDSSLNQNLVEYCIALGDDSLILGHRLSEWCRNGPFLEEDLALTNVALDFVGRARLFYGHAAELEDNKRSEDDIAYLRDCREYRNFLINELPNGDFAFTMARQLMIDVYDVAFFTALTKSIEPTLAAIANKAIKESNYHLRRSKDWILRLGDGTKESHDRVQASVDTLWRFTGELFAPDEVDNVFEAEFEGPDLFRIREQWEKDVAAVLQEATLVVPEEQWMASGGKEGQHTEHFGFMIAEMQYLQRANPGATW